MNFCLQTGAIPWNWSSLQPINHPASPKENDNNSQHPCLSGTDTTKFLYNLEWHYFIASHTSRNDELRKWSKKVRANASRAIPNGPFGSSPQSSRLNVYNSDSWNKEMIDDPVSDGVKFVPITKSSAKIDGSWKSLNLRIHKQFW